MFLFGQASRPPVEYIDFLLIKELYHCKPSDLDNEDNAVIEMHRQFRSIENRQSDIEARRAEQRAKLNSN